MNLRIGSEFWGLGFRVEVQSFGVKGLGWNLRIGSDLWGLGFRVELKNRFRVLGFRVELKNPK